MDVWDDQYNMCIRLTKGYVLSSKLKVKDEKQDTKNINIEKNVLDENQELFALGVVERMVNLNMIFMKALLV